MNNKDKSEPRINEWLLGEKILHLTHRWDIIFFLIFLGALIGWGVSFLWPSPYRATRDIYVGLNAYRFADDTYAESLSGQPFRLVDDYKNWQMEQLNDLVTTEDFFQETLDLLRENDPYWEVITPGEFRQMSMLMWRNVGEWHLIVEATNAERAEQAVLAWEETILSRINQGINHARQMVALDIEMNQLIENQQSLELRQEKLTFIREELSSLMDDLGSRPEGSFVSSREHSNLLGLVAQAADWTPAWDRILDEAPRDGSTYGDILSWILNVEAMVGEELNILPEQISLIDQSIASLSDQYHEEAARSFGLASTLVIDGDETIATTIELVRPKGILILVGAIFGLTIWILWSFRTIQNWKKS